MYYKLQGWIENNRLRVGFFKIWAKYQLHTETHLFQTIKFYFNNKFTRIYT